MKILLTTLLLATTFITSAKDFGKIIDEIVVPLSSPNKIGKLKSTQVYGGIRVTGYEGKEVMIIVHQRQRQYKVVKKHGLIMIPNNAFNLDIEEKNNTVMINSHPRGSNPAINLEIKVPKNFNLNINNINNGNSYISGVNGEFEISNINGDVTLESVNGSATIDTVNGKITADFITINANTNMAFSTINKDIDITYPKSTKANVKIKTLKGNIFTGFDMKLMKSKQKSDNSHSKSKHKYGIEQWVKGEINGGGPEYTFSSINGDVIIREQE
jgi:hypothetical protein